MNVNNLKPSLCKIHETIETIETIETNGETNGAFNNPNNLKNTNNLNNPCPRRMETNGRKPARDKCPGFPSMLLDLGLEQRTSSPRLIPGKPLPLSTFRPSSKLLIYANYSYSMA